MGISGMLGILQVVVDTVVGDYRLWSGLASERLSTTSDSMDF